MKIEVEVGFSQCFRMVCEQSNFRKNHKIEEKILEIKVFRSSPKETIAEKS